jgi:zinc transport system substrate-binding protein
LRALHSLVHTVTLGVLLLAFTHCGPASTARNSDTPLFCVTIAPLGAYLTPIVAGRAEVRVLLPPGASPHTYEITPADARAAASAQAIIYVDKSLDAWAARLDAPVRLRFLDGVPAEKLRHFDGDTVAHNDHDHEHGELDPHVWLDPELMRSGLDYLIAELSKLDPGGAEIYRKNGETFAVELTRLDDELAASLAPLKDHGVIQFHPALYYFLGRYGIRTAGVIENIAGQEPSPKQIKSLADLVAAEKVEVLITEPQLPDAPVRALAEATGARIARMDPLGGVPGRMTYAEILRYNANTLLEAFE